MSGSNRFVLILALVCLIAFSSVQLLPAEEGLSGANCSFRNSPDEFISAQSRARNAVFDRAKAYRFGAAASGTLDPESVERRNVIDDEIFGKMATAGVRSAAPATDAEFLRRVTLDLTGRLPSPAAVRAFLTDNDPGKRDRVIDALLASPEFTDKWTMWAGDWLRNSASNATSYSPQQLAGRNAFYKYMWLSIAADKSFREMTYEILSANGNNYDEASGAINFLSSAGAPGGPAQDTYDAMLVKSATTFLGLGHYDCLLCHNGRGHLDQLSVWGKGVNRQDAEKMSAFFARTNLVRWTPPAGVPNDNTQFYFNSYSLQDVTNRTYDLNTNFGNRPNRVSVGAVVRLTPEYRETARKPGGENWRTWFAAMILDDPLFAKNIVNRVWKQMFNLALAEPVDGLDPARLDPSTTPPEGWSMQASHPELLSKLSAEFVSQRYSLRALLKTIVSSSAYQLSSRYEDEWKLEYVPLFARHYPRRLDGEEVHDLICGATGVFNKYTQFNWGENVSYAMQLLDPVEPRSNGGAASFMNFFLRGNRDTTTRSQNLSVQQGMALMNDTFVTAKLKVNASPGLQAVSKMSANDAIVDELFLRFIGRLPGDVERARALSYLAKATTAAQKNAIIEDLAWALVNKIEFLFSY